MPLPSNNLRVACQKHGEHTAWVLMDVGQGSTFYCLRCLHEVLTRLGVHAMFPVKADAPDANVEWPESLEIEE